MTGLLSLHRITSIKHRVDHWYANSPNVYAIHVIELTFENGESLDIRLFTSNTSVTFEQSPMRNVPGTEAPAECSICRRAHGPEVTHASE